MCEIIATLFTGGLNLTTTIMNDIFRIRTHFCLSFSLESPQVWQLTAAAAGLDSFSLGSGGDWECASDSSYLTSSHPLLAALIPVFTFRLQLSG
ncbi:hypothetical protein PoB_003073400 [Plakobranchus ocellatus]|uniref:Uncharacterized protein n=1 Tax=Plakobranchus ocellatus TaxID=259542 RepID=A0AAV4ADD4_9GAST|nr:hypothetical protein PoB_003073400 [Plakobranchus ocellatus]